MHTERVYIHTLSEDGIATAYNISPVKEKGRVVIDGHQNIDRAKSEMGSRDIGALRLYRARDCNIEVYESKKVGENRLVTEFKRQIEFDIESIGIPASPDGSFALIVYNLVLPVGYYVERLVIGNPDGGFDYLPTVVASSEVKAKSDFQYDGPNPRGGVADGTVEFFWDSGSQMQGVMIKLHTTAKTVGFRVMGTLVNPPVDSQVIGTRLHPGSLAEADESQKNQVVKVFSNVVNSTKLGGSYFSLLLSDLTEIRMSDIKELPGILRKKTRR